MHGVPVTTPHNRVCGHVTHDVKSEPIPCLNAVEETFLKECASLSYGKTRKQVLSIVEGVAHDNKVLRKGKISTGVEKVFGKAGQPDIEEKRQGTLL